MQFICVSRRLDGHDIEKIKSLALAETEVSWQLYRDGVFQNLHFDEAKSKGLILLHAKDEAEVRSQLAKLPLVQHKQIDFDVYAMGPYTRVEALFKEA